MLTHWGRVTHICVGNHSRALCIISKRLERNVMDERDFARIVYEYEFRVDKLYFTAPQYVCCEYSLYPRKTGLEF